MGTGHHFQHLSGADPQAGGQACRPLEYVVVGAHPIKGHQAPHGGAGQDGVQPVGKGAVVFVDVGLESVHHPVHHNVALAPDFAVLGVGIGDGCVFDEAAVALMVALHGHHDQLLAALLQELVHAPGFSEGGVLVKKHVVSVKHIHDGIALLLLFLIGIRKIDIGLSGHISGQLGNDNIPFFDHCLSSLHVFRSFVV